MHLVGHSQGGAVALRVACMRPTRIASLSLYEPTAFHVLKHMGEDGAAALAEIRELAADIDRGVVSGAYRVAAQRFVDYWNGAGSFAALKPQVQADMIRYAPKSGLDFRASIDERTPLAALRRLRIPTLPAAWTARADADRVDRAQASASDAVSRRLQRSRVPDTWGRSPMRRR